MTSLKWSLCRLCLRSDCTLLDAYLDKEMQVFQLPEVIRELLQLVLSEDGGLPTTVCTCCISKLRDFQVFKNRVLKCDKLLRVIVRDAVQVLGANVDLNRAVEEENVELTDSVDVNTNDHQWTHSETSVYLDDVDIEPSSSSLLPQVEMENVELNDSVDVNTNNHVWTHNEDSVDLSDMDIKPSSSSLLPQVPQNLSDDGHHRDSCIEFEEDTDFTLYLESDSEGDVESIGGQGGNVNSSVGDGYPSFAEESFGNSALISTEQDDLEKSPLEKGQCGDHLEGGLKPNEDSALTQSRECSPHALPIDESYGTGTSTYVRRSVRLQCSRYRSKISGRDCKNSQGMQSGCMAAANVGLLMPGVTASEDVEPSKKGECRRTLRSGSSFTDNQLKKRMENQQNCKGPMGAIKERACKMRLNNERECIRDERRAELLKKKRDYLHRHHSSSSVDKEAFLQKRRIYNRRYYKSMSVEKKAAILQRQIINYHRRNESMSAEKKEEILQKNRIYKKRCYDSMSNEKKAAFLQRQAIYYRRYYMSMSAEKKAAVLQKKRIHKKRCYDSLSVEKKESMLQKQKEYTRRYLSSMSVEKRETMLQKLRENNGRYYANRKRKASSSSVVKIVS